MSALTLSYHSKLQGYFNLSLQVWKAKGRLLRNLIKMFPQNLKKLQKQAFKKNTFHHSYEN